MLRGLWREGTGALLVLIVRVATLPRTPWEQDELLFAPAVLRFDPWSSHPHPPGYPLFVGLGKLFNLFLHDPFASLVALNVVCSMLAFVALSRAFRLYLDDDDLAVCGALLFSFSATVIVHGPLAFSDSPAMLFVALTLRAVAAIGDDATIRSAIVLGVASSSAIGARPQLLVPLVPLLLFAVIVAKSGRQFAAALAAFTAMSLLWFVPLMNAAGGWSRFIEWETRQAAYVAAHDAGLSRGARSAGMLVARFVAHPWGPKAIAIPVLAFAAIGAVTSLRRRPRMFVPLALFGAVQLVFELTTMDPADAARYSIPFVAIVAAFAAAGFGLLRMRIAPHVVTAIIAIASVIYVSPILIDRTDGPSPPAAAAAFANQHFSRDTVVLYDLALKSHADYLMRFRSMSIDDGLRANYDRPDVPLVVFADGGAPSSEATFAWHASDAYGKLTRNHYRRVALAPLPPNERFLPLEGVHAPERTIEGENEWRWLAKEASLRLPSQHGDNATFDFRLSPDAPYDANPIRIFVNGNEAASLVVAKVAGSVNVALPPGPCGITIRAEHSFHPAAILGNRDPREVAVQLLRVQSGRRAV
ncbi:MAG: hypothetical protein QOI24_931 [Acidobacteriota bacterium]|nr:hypothetical protein [Acidobacteriota bacterium]